MSSAQPFAGFNPKPSAWGFNWTAPEQPVVKPSPPQPQVNNCPSPEPVGSPMPDQYANMPAALINSLKREKKPFTYTPGGVNLSEVLNARLQKRMERKKKYSQERAAEVASSPPPRQVIVMPTYNTPLDMYSMANAVEALELQAGLVAADKRHNTAEDIQEPAEVSPYSQFSYGSRAREDIQQPLQVSSYSQFSYGHNAGEYTQQPPQVPSFSQFSHGLSGPSRSATLPRNHTFKFENDVDPARGVAQSKAFRVLQIITDTEEDSSERPRSQHLEQMRFTGLRENKADIPSRFFHTLQKITGTDEEEEPSGTTDVRPFERLHQHQHQHHQQQQQQPISRPTFVQPPPAQPSSAPTLRRPAAFLPIKTSPGFRPVQPPCISNGPVRRNPAAGTDF